MEPVRRSMTNAAAAAKLPIAAAPKTNPVVAPTPAAVVAVVAIPAPVVAAPSNPAPVAEVAPVPPPPSLKDQAFAELQLQSIFYSRTNASAIISGQRVHTRDRLPAGATVVAIGPSSVTLEYENERRTLALQ